MSLPEIILDDRSFQDLVNEARVKITQTCPEWTEHNVSDPGITLIELFAWMTDMLVYRVNRIPDKLHLALMELLDIRPESPRAASTRLRFRLSAPAADPLPIPAGETEVGTLRTAGEEGVVFQTTRDVTIPAARPTVYAVKRGSTVKDVGVANGTARPKGADQLAFGQPPSVGDALLLGFDTSLASLLVRVQVECSQARGAGVEPDDPPLRWEVSDDTAAGGWVEAQVLEDRTGGFNYGSGEVELELPDGHGVASLAGHRAYWLRCRLDDRTRAGHPSRGFQAAPEIYRITAAPIGAVIPATHAVRETDELLGTSDGTPAQVFPLRRGPVLRPHEGERLEVHDAETGGWRPWQRVESFVESGPRDAHFVLDEVAGRVELGPAVRAPDGSWRQYGAIPPKGAALRFSRYRHGGGRRGNVAAETLTVLKRAIPGVASVVNPQPATGGIDVETLESTRQRAAMEIRTRYRAVTAEDFEFLCGEASPRVARAVCLPPGQAGVIRLHLVPRVEDPERSIGIDELVPEEALLEEVGRYLDERRLLGTDVELLPARYRGVSVVAGVRVTDRSDTARVEADVARALYGYLNPVVGGGRPGEGDGWGFGRPLNQGELFGVVQAVEGVEFVKILRVYETDLTTGEQQAQPAPSHLDLGPDEVIASGTHIVRAERRER